jgi:membrane-associated phospholipid phosphatase
MIDLTSPWYVVTLLGAPELWAMFSVLVFVIMMAMRVINKGKRDRKTKESLKEFVIRLAPTLVLTFMLVLVFKGFFAVPRQCVPCITELTGCNPYCPVDSSFPSGHAATVFAGFTVIWQFAGMKREWLVIYVIPALVAISRIMLGVHTWQDVLAGAMLGIAVALIVREIDKKI